MPQDFTHYDAVIADLKSQRDRLTSMIDMLEQMKSVGMPFTASNAGDIPPRTASGAPEIPHDAFFGMTIPEAAKKYLSIIKRTAPHPALCDALLAGGFTTSSPNFREVVRSTLGRMHDDFVKISGQWGLREWYGTRGKRKSKRGTSSAAEDSMQGRHEDQEDEYSDEVKAEVEKAEV